MEGSEGKVRDHCALRPLVLLDCFMWTVLGRCAGCPSQVRGHGMLTHVFKRLFLTWSWKHFFVT